MPTIQISEILNNLGFETFALIAKVVNYTVWDVAIIFLVIISGYFIKNLLQEKTKINELKEWIRLPILVLMPIIPLLIFYIIYSIITLTGFKIIIQNIMYKVLVGWFISMFLYDSIIKKIQKALPKKEIKKEDE